MHLLGRWNWWFPKPAAKILFARESTPSPEPARS